MKKKIEKTRRWGAALALLLLGAAFLFTGQPRSADRELTPEEVEASALCGDCHDGYSAGLTHTAHDVTLSQNAGDVFCASCHSGAAAHVQDPSVDNIGNPATLPADELNNLCATCHQPHGGAGAAGLDVHLERDLTCIQCHAPHEGAAGLLPAERKALCENCHSETLLQFQRNSNHPLGDGVVDCVDCHDFTGANEPNFGHGGSANCYQCHPEQSGPFIFEHPVTISQATEGEGCISCHEPHGSPNERLLRTDDSNLCQSCHGVPPLHRTKHVGLGVRYDCVTCHSETHGSNHNSNMLDPDLGMKLFPNCYQSGCHADAINQ